MSQTEISGIRITPIAIGDPPLLNAAGLHAPYALRLIVELTTRGGVTGISEIPGSQSIHQSILSLQERLIGLDIFNLNVIREKIRTHFKDASADERGDKPWDQRKATHIVSAVEVACLDIMGKELNRPVAELLGGAFRDRVPFAAYLFFKYEGAGGALGFATDPAAKGWEAQRQAKALTPEEIVIQAQSMCAHFGFQSIKLKGGVFSPEVETESIFALRKAFGEDIPLRLDPNAIWKPVTGLYWGKKMEGILEYLEDPVRGQEAMADLRRQIRTPLATNMCTISFDQLPSSHFLGSEDIILCDHHFWGGMRSCLELYNYSKVFNRKISMHSNSHLGISLAAMVHLGAAMPTIEYAFDTHYPWQMDEVIKGGKIPIEEGCVPVPRGPGLGVEIDHEALEALHQNYLTCGLKERNDEIEMQKVQPGWQFKPIRW